MKFILFLFLQQAFALERRQLKAVPTLLMKQEKFCKDCRFFKKDFFTETKYGNCARFPSQLTSDYLVDGFKDTSPSSYHYCGTARKFDHMCGPEGKYFESKN